MEKDDWNQGQIMEIWFGDPIMRSDLEIQFGDPIWKSDLKI